MYSEHTQAIEKEIVLIGAGHTHVIVLKMLAMKPIPGVRITLISPDLRTPYTGMLPGMLAGNYCYDEILIDLHPLCRFTNTRFIQAEVESLDPQRKRVHCAGRPPIHYDVVSINTGSTPTLETPGASEFAVAVKPVARFYAHWQRIQDEFSQVRSAPYHIAVVGAGAAGVELAMSIQCGLLAQHPDKPLEIHLISSDSQILAGYPTSVRRRLLRELHDKGIQLQLDFSIKQVAKNHLLATDGTKLSVDTAIWATHASARGWPADSGLATDERGFITTNDFLQSLSDDSIFAVGDCATQVAHPRPKAGVYAVRQGAPLAHNLRRYLQAKPLRAFKPQSRFLSLLLLPPRSAVAAKAGLSGEGRWVWRWKDRIDRNFMARFKDLPAMEEPPLTQNSASAPALRNHMRCAGCGSKVGNTLLSRVLGKLAITNDDSILIGLNQPDDAAVIIPPQGKVLVQTVDAFRTMVSDSYLFGQISALHALSDIFAMGAKAHSAMAIVTIPYASEKVMEGELLQTMSGALKVLNDHDVTLIGGHTNEGQDLSLGFSVNGFADRETLLQKNGMHDGDVILLTKPLGTGVILAADMRHQAKGAWLQSAVESMLLSNYAAAKILYEHGASACTDVTGFGLLGHLLEMINAQTSAHSTNDRSPEGIEVTLALQQIPVMAGAIELLAQGISSTLQPENLRQSIAIRNAQAFSDQSRYQLLFDPQTSGGLLASLPREKAEAAIEALKQANHTSSTIIGSIATGYVGDCPVLLE